MIEKIKDDELRNKTLNSLNKDTSTVAYFYKCALGQLSKCKGDIKQDWKIIVEVLRKDLSIRKTIREEGIIDG